MRTTAAILVAGAVIIGPIFVLKPSLQNSVEQVVASTMSKGDSQSYEQRSGLDAAAVATVGQTDGLGVGWGSFRASSLIPSLLANAGIFGVAMVAWLVWRMTALVNSAGRRAPGHPGRIVVDGFIAAICGQLAAALLSSPTIGLARLPFSSWAAPRAWPRAWPVRRGRPQARPAQARPAEARSTPIHSPETQRGQLA